MKKDEQLRMIRKSVDAWNQMRLENSALQPDLSQANLYKANLGKANLRCAKLIGIDLTRANLDGADLCEADLQDADLREADFRGANLSKANLREVAFGEATLRGADLSGADLRCANLAGADLIGTNLSGAFLCEADLHEGSLRMANLSQADLRKANLRGANLREADLRGGNLSGTDLTSADLSAANLSSTDLTGCILEGVNLDRTTLSGADVSGALFWNIANTGWKIDGIKASHVYFCRGRQEEREKYRQDFEEGQFEALHQSLPTLELVFEKGLCLTQIMALNALIEKISRENPDFDMKPAGISKNAFSAIVGVTVGKDAFLPEATKRIQDAIDHFNRGIPDDMFIPQLSQLLSADVVNALGNTLKAQPANLVINLDQPVITLVNADGSSSVG